MAAADASRSLATIGVDGAASDADVAARALEAAADASRICATIGGDGAASDDDVSTSCRTTIGADASASVATLCGDDAALNPDIAAGIVGIRITAADARALISALHGQRARGALDGQRRASVASPEGGIILAPAGQRVRRAVLQDDGGVAQALDAVVA